MTRSIGGVCSLIGRKSTARASTPDTLNCSLKKGKSELASLPVIAESQGILKSTFVYSETKFLDGEGGEPNRKAFLLGQVHRAL